MTDLGEVRRLAFDIVAARGYLGDRPGAVVFHLAGHLVAHHHRVGVFDALGAELAPDAAGHHLSVCAAHLIPAAGRFHHQAFH